MISIACASEFTTCACVFRVADRAHVFASYIYHSWLLISPLCRCCCFVRETEIVRVFPLSAFFLAFRSAPPPWYVEVCVLLARTVDVAAVVHDRPIIDDDRQGENAVHRSFDRSMMCCDAMLTTVPVALYV